MVGVCGVRKNQLEACALEERIGGTQLPEQIAESVKVARNFRGSLGDGNENAGLDYLSLSPD